MNKNEENVHNYAQPVKVGRQALSVARVRTAVRERVRERVGRSPFRRQKNLVTPMNATVPMPIQ